MLLFHCFAVIIMRTVGWYR